MVLVVSPVLTLQNTGLADQSRIKAGLNVVTDPSVRVPVDRNSKSRELLDNRALPCETIGNADVCKYGESQQTPYYPIPAYPGNNARIDPDPFQLDYVK